MKRNAGRLIRSRCSRSVVRWLGVNASTTGEAVVCGVVLEIKAGTQMGNVCWVLVPVAKQLTGFIGQYQIRQELAH